MITESLTLTEDLVCPATTGFALRVVGKDLALDGGGHRIVAPLAAAALFAQGENLSLRNLVINGVTGGDGILAYETPGLQVTGNDLSGNLQGLVVYADTGMLPGAVITGNVARNNSLFGIRTGFDAPGAVILPRIAGNDVSGSGDYGLLVRAKDFDLGGSSPNVFGNSRNGLYLAGGNANLHDLTFANDRIERVTIFADSLAGLVATNVGVPTAVPADASQARIGLQLYRVGYFLVQGLDGSGNDVGIKLDTAGGVKPGGVVTGSKFGANPVSGILAVTSDGTPYGQVRFTANCYPATAPRVTIGPSATLGAGSVPDDGLDACGAAGKAGAAAAGLKARR